MVPHDSYGKLSMEQGILSISHLSENEMSLDTSKEINLISMLPEWLSQDSLTAHRSFDPLLIT